MTRRRAIIFLILTAVLWSSSGLFIKIIQWGAFSILSGRSILAAIVFLIYLRRPNFRWTRLQVVGALGYMGTQLFFIISTKLTVAANAIFLQYTSPLYILLLGYWFLKERPYPADIWTMVVIFIGMLLFLGDGMSFSGFQGNMFGALSGLAMAVMILCMRRQKKGIPANTILLGNLIGILVGLPALIQESFCLSNIGIISYLGIVQIGLAYLLYSIAIKYLRALESTLIIFLEPILNPVWVFLIIGEIPGLLAVFGGILILGAIVVRALISSRTVTDVATQKG